MATYRITVPYRAMGTRLFQPGEEVTNEELGGKGEHLVNIGRAVRLSAPDPVQDDDEEREPADTGNTSEGEGGAVDLDAIASEGLPNFDEMNKVQLIEWAEGHDIKVDKRHSPDTIIETILKALE